jgi:hypothetical protein
LSGKLSSVDVLVEDAVREGIESGEEFGGEEDGEYGRVG